MERKLSNYGKAALTLAALAGAATARAATTPLAGLSNELAIIFKGIGRAGQSHRLAQQIAGAAEKNGGFEKAYEVALRATLEGVKHDLYEDKELKEKWASKLKAQLFTALEEALKDNQRIKGILETNKHLEWGGLVQAILKDAQLIDSGECGSPV